MQIGVPKEVRPGETRVAVTPETAKKLIAHGFSIVVESGAGLASAVDDAAYTAAGATICTAASAWSSPIVLKVDAPTVAEAQGVLKGALVVSFAWPSDHPDVIEALSAAGASFAGLEFVPRIARAQRMDVLSSMANLAGYRAVLEASTHFGRFFPMLMTAAGQIPPAHVLVIGAGVAGLSAIATAKRLGAVVRAFDTRSAVKDQVKSVGARFLELDIGDTEDKSGYAKQTDAEQTAKIVALLDKNARECDIVVTTALVGGKFAPRLIEAPTVLAMRRGSVIVDLAAARGGNCALTKADEVVRTENGVTILGPTNLGAAMPIDASRLYARNLLQLITHLVPKGAKSLDLATDDEITKGVVLLRDGERVHPALRS